MRVRVRTAIEQEPGDSEAVALRGHLRSSGDRCRTHQGRTTGVIAAVRSMALFEKRSDDSYIPLRSRPAKGIFLLSRERKHPTGQQQAPTHKIIIARSNGAEWPISLLHTPASRNP